MTYRVPFGLAHTPSEHSHRCKGSPGATNSGVTNPHACKSPSPRPGQKRLSSTLWTPALGLHRERSALPPPIGWGEGRVRGSLWTLDFGLWTLDSASMTQAEILQIFRDTG